MPETPLDPRKRVVELTKAEADVLCAWVHRATAGLPAPGARIRCKGEEFPFPFFISCDVTQFPADCPATVGDTQACTTAIVRVIRPDPCLLAAESAIATMSRLMAETPPCSTACAYDLKR